ncbi:MAG: alpha/beta fold hydrolase [Cereibacter sp.]
MMVSFASRFLRTALRVALVVLVLIGLLLVGFRWSATSRETIAFGEGLPSDGMMISTSEGAVFALNAGRSGQPQVLFAHGTAAWSGLWRPTLDATAGAGFYATAFDMPPFGWSEHPTGGDFSRKKQAKRVIALLEALGTRPIIVAHSIGAGPMTEAILERPDLVSGLVIVAGAIALNSHEDPQELPVALRPDGLREFITSATAANPWLTGTFLQQFIHVKTAATPERIAMLQEPLQRQGYTAALNAWLPQLFETPVDALSTRPEHWQSLDLPVVLIWGREDNVTPPAQGEELSALIPDARLMLLDGVGHIPQIEAPEAFQAALIEALESISISTTKGIEE